MFGENNLLFAIEKKRPTFIKYIYTYLMYVGWRYNRYFYQNIMYIIQICWNFIMLIRHNYDLNFGK